MTWVKRVPPIPLGFNLTLNGHLGLYIRHVSTSDLIPEQVAGWSWWKRSTHNIKRTVRRSQTSNIDKAAHNGHIQDFDRVLTVPKFHSYCLVSKDRYESITSIIVCAQTRIWSSDRTNAVVTCWLVHKPSVLWFETTRVMKTRMRDSEACGVDVILGSQCSTVRVSHFAKTNPPHNPHIRRAETALFHRCRTISGNISDQRWLPSWADETSKRQSFMQS